MMARRNWTREEDLAVLYGKLTHGDSFRTRPDLRTLAMNMGRTTDSLIMRKANFDSLDPSVHSSGLGNAAQLTEAIWDEYVRDSDAIMAEARQAYLNILSGRPR